jgi:hypothetical protein
MIPFMNDTQSVEGQPRLHVLDVLGVGRDQASEAAGRDDRRLAQLLEDPLDHTIDLGGETVEHAGLD